MDKNSQIEPSKLTKVIVHKIHGGRKRDSKFWQSDFGHYDSSIEKPIGVDDQLIQSKSRRLFLKVILSTIPLLFTAVLFRPDTFSFLSYKSIFSSLREFFPKKENEFQFNYSPRPSVPESVPGSSISATPEVVPKQRNNPVPNSNLYSRPKQYGSLKGYPAQPRETQTAPREDSDDSAFYKNIFEIELLTGRNILTENAMVTEDKVSYQTEAGDILTINRYEVKRMKRYKVKR